MRTTENTTSTVHRMRMHRARLRAAGLRPVQIWVPDVRMPRLAQEAQRQSLLAARHAGEQDCLAFIEEAAETGARP